MLEMFQNKSSPFADILFSVYPAVLFPEHEVFLRFYIKLAERTYTENWFRSSCEYLQESRRTAVDTPGLLPDPLSLDDNPDI